MSTTALKLDVTGLTLLEWQVEKRQHTQILSSPRLSSIKACIMSRVPQCGAPSTSFPPH